MTLSDFSTPALQADRRLTGELLEDFLGNFPHIRLTVTGGCMNPLLPPGQRVLIASTARRTPRLGDVVLVRHPQGLRLHRLVWTAGRTWRTKGDRSRCFDPRVAPENVLGVVVEAEGGAGVRRGWRRATVRSLCSGAWARFRADRPGSRAPRTRTWLRRATRVAASVAAALLAVSR